MSPSTDPEMPRIDHLIYACADLERGSAEIEALLGTAPVIGGRHPRYGTHNALLSLGPTTYLEIIARDPDLQPPDRGAWIDVPAGDDSRLLTWVLRAEQIDASASAASGIGLGPIQSGRRQAPDGSELSWRLTDPYALPLGGVIPFLISWGDTPHPARSAPRAGTLHKLTIAHPDPERVSAALDALGIELDVAASADPGLIATIETAGGLIELR